MAGADRADLKVQVVDGDGADATVLVINGVVLDSSGASSGDVVTWDGSTFILLTPGAASLPTGGTTGQVLTKQSNGDGDADWETPTPGGAAALDDLTDVVTTGVAMGDTIRWDGANWVDAPASNLDVVLGTAAEADTGDFDVAGAAAAAQSAAISAAATDATTKANAAQSAAATDATTKANAAQAAAISTASSDATTKANAAQAAAEATAATDATTKANAAAAASVAKTLYDAESIVIAISDNTPVVLPVGTSTVVGRKSSGDIVALTAGELAAILAGNVVLRSLYDANSILAATSDDVPAVLTVGASTFVGRKASGDISAMTATEAAALLTSLVPKSLFDANTMLYATSDDTPVALTIAASRIVGRKASGDIAAMTGAEASALLVAASIPIVDAGALITATDVEGALAELAAGTLLTSLAGYRNRVASNAGASFTHSVGTTPTTFWSGSKYDIPANSLAVGEELIIEGWGTILNNSGAARDYTVTAKADAVTLVALTTSIGAQVTNSATSRYFEFCFRARVTSIGGSGVLACTGYAEVDDVNVGIAGTLIGTGVNQKFQMRYLGDATVDTTQALTLDVLGTFSNATSSQNFTPKAIFIDKVNAP